MSNRSFRPGTLWSVLVARTAHAVDRGALRPIETTQIVLEDGGVRFLVRQVSSLALKPPTELGRPLQRADPFLPYDPDLFVADLSATHVALLNKFNVLAHHLLIVTRAFESQNALIDLDDFEAWFACLTEFDGLGFYNGGLEAGASQQHKHMQVVPMPLGDSGQSLPIATLIEAATFDGTVGTLPRLPFEHAFARLAPVPPEQEAAQALDRYRLLLDAVGLRTVGSRTVNVDGRMHHCAPYNLLVTRQWMLLVPRSIECTDGISVNALGFAGSLFVKDAAQLDAVRRIGPMTVLQRVALPRQDIA